MSSVCVIGAGAWGTALAIHAARLGHEVALWARHPARIRRENPRLPGVPLPEAVRVVDAPKPADCVLVAVPMQHLRRVLLALRPVGPLVLCCKGFEAGTGLMPLEVTARVLPGASACVLTGPNFALEIAAGLPAAAVIAGGDASLRAEVLSLLAGPAFRLYGNDDSVGAQLGGAAKNIFAIAAGAVTGAGLGENARAALITRGVAEMARLAVALGGRAETVSGLSGLGDMILSCGSSTSRNFALGFSLGQGAALTDLLSADGPVVEGVATAPAILARAGDLDLPVIRAVADLLAGEVTLGEAIGRLLARKLKDE
jgi:glycerol-3-phosphate dehydrogenase (NAD(P)+)